MGVCEYIEAKYCNYEETKLKGNYLRTFFCSDKKTYVVKFLNSAMGKRILPNEYISGLLASHLKLPCHSIKLIEIDSYLIEGNDELSIFKAGTHVGIEYDFNSNVLTPWRVGKITNIEDIIKIFVFDQWIYNLDRGSEYSNLLISDREGILSIIDHSEAFGWRKWEIQNLLESINEAISFTKSDGVYSSLSTLTQESTILDDVNKFINQIKGVPYQVIEDIVKSMPSEWGITSEEENHIIDYLVNRQNSIGNLMKMKNSLLIGVG
ncbi:hypothetical protein ABW02_06900 [Niallia circulans]|uniref:HipA-like kinase domain-containing protein n=1 Tax=Niallia circulans TaxID=1397 RepID=A0A0J1IMN8_NIACI|nr:HipA family kinase [Niallia circulans]KLV27242.1 hypothetical protein ABW02_06900 [Niallia circulans]